MGKWKWHIGGSLSLSKGERGWVRGSGVVQGFDVLLKPLDQFYKPEGVGLEEMHKVGVGFFAIAVDVAAIHTQEDISDTKGDTFIAVHEWMVHGQALKNSSGLFCEALIVSNLRAHQSGLQCPDVTEAKSASKLLNQIVMDSDDFLNSWEMLGHYSANNS